MTWAKLTDDILSHPRMLRAGEDAANLHLRATVYCARYLTDGRVEVEYLPAITRRPDAADLAARLVKAGAWDDHPDGGWTIRDFLRDQPSAEEVEAKRARVSAARAAAGRKGGLRSGAIRGTERGEATKQTGNKPEANGKQPSEANANPRPDPSRKGNPPTPLAGGGGVVGGEGSASGRSENGPAGAVAAPSEAPDPSPLTETRPGASEAPAGAPAGSGGHPPAPPKAPTSATPMVAAMVRAGGLAEPNLHAAAELEAQLAKKGVTPELAAAWGKALATPEGRAACWPWAHKVAEGGPMQVSFLKGAKLAEGQDQWDRLGDGFAAWRTLHARRETARRRAEADAARRPAQPARAPIRPMSPADQAVVDFAAGRPLTDAQRALLDSPDLAPEQRAVVADMRRFFAGAPS